MDMSELQQLLPELRRLVAALEQPKRLDETLWSTEQIAQWLGLSKATVELRVVTRKDFPAGMRPVESQQAQRRWFASDVLEWARRNRGTLPTPRPGRRRKTD
ncbi:DNA-binding protein [Burkholderia sp. Bp9017]|uniref:helix-turn-helix domain-containing protein n=1 Tax=unclassified Burkholderia TaxID=2613784 RepID=UPI000F5F6DE1|nr:MULTISPECIES: helix-turn-helix domain-containing protein [unclassified Burkholderia]RQZ27335.1 DNA-binding protein [Burkholderia sp. Bp9017]RQZ34614.1 DNA-binding protein [Burkholderia sp. Bp9016]